MAYSEQIVVNNASGLHARPAATLVKAAGQCKGTVTIIKGDKRVNAKSIISLLTAGVKKGDEITVEVDNAEESELQRMLDVIRDLKE